jgi:S-disulfanyl-L-cysteine oxidoreductase SoxD
MAGYLLLGIYEEPAPAADAVERIRRLGVPENRITIMSAFPIRSTVLGRRHGHSRLSLITIVGALLGALTALALVAGTPLLYPVPVGGQPLWPIPPQLIILFEMTMLGTMWATFIGMLLLGRFPVYGDTVKDARIGSGHIGVSVETDQTRADRAEAAFKDTGAIDVQRMPARQQIDLTRWWLWLLTVVLILGVASILGGLVAYDVIKVPWFDQMKNQVSTAYEQGPRKAAPQNAAPIQGPVLINETTPATQPIPPTANSLQSGQILYGETCALCHGQTGEGNGPIGGFMVAGGSPAPFNLTSPEVQSLTDQQIFVVITNGFGTMPSLLENLTVPERWDVVNWVRTLKK